KNTFTDFIACAEYLIKEKYTSPERLVIAGGSAGGLLMGAVVNMRPDLFKVVIAKVPFVDVLNTMLDPTIPLTVIEYDEWGNPNQEEYYFYIKSYSPYDNVERKAYPNMLITAGLNDPRVQYWEPAKWTAKLRALKTDDNLLLLKTNMGAGHGGASGRYDYLKDIAFEYAFILKCLGMVED
ncbi:MAG: S9 family peptidase, partial [Calditrichaeota bacterium]